MTKSSDFLVRFWGVRGSVACPGHDTLRYGGNTSCIEVRCGEHLFILDGGTGLRELGHALAKENPLDADVFFSHTHLDHIGGVPFFSAVFNPKNRFRFYAGHLLPAHDLQGVLRHMMTSPLFPVPPEIFSANITYHDFMAGETLQPKPGVTIRTVALNHPNGATGYRIEYAGRSVCYVTDTEHPVQGLDQNILGLIKEADIMIYDCTYTDEEYPRFKNWGHSTWQQGMRLCEAGGVNTFVIFHHDPSHDDDFMDRVAKEASQARAGTIVAHEGLTLIPGQK